MSSGLISSLTELTHWPISNRLTHLFSFLSSNRGVFVVILLQFVLYCCCCCCWHIPLMDKHDRSPLFFLCCPSLSDFSSFFLPHPLSPATNSGAHVYNVFILFFSSLLSFPFFPFFKKCLMFCPFSSVVFLFFPPQCSIILLMHGTHLMPW